MSISIKRVIVVLFFSSIQIQLTFAQFGVGYGFSGALLTGDTPKRPIGIGYYLEPKYVINEKLSVGLTGSLMFFQGVDVDYISTGIGFFSLSNDVELNKLMFQIGAFGDYIFKNNRVSPFVGLGVSYYRVIEDTPMEAFEEIQIFSRVGIAPRVGVFLGKFNIAGILHLIKDGSYASLRLGVDIGARRKY